MLNASIKSEQNSDDVPLWKQAPPNNIQLPVIPERDPNRKITPEQYSNLLMASPHEFLTLEEIDNDLKRIILKEIELTPTLWKSINPHIRGKFYPRVGCGVYKRSGMLVAPKVIIRIFEMARNNMRNYVRIAIQSKKLNPKETEDYCWRNDLYGSVRFQRETMQDWEKKLRMNLLKDADGNPVLCDVDDEEEEVVVEDPIFEDEEAYEMEEAIPNLPPVHEYQHPPPVQDYQVHQEEFRPPRVNIKRDNGYFQEQEAPIEQPTTSQERSSIEYNPMNPQPIFQQPVVQEGLSSVQQEDMKVDLMTLNHNMTRLAREQPQRVKVIRDAMMQTLLAFDRKEYDNMGHLFSDLAKIFNN